MMPTAISVPLDRISDFDELTHAKFQDVETDLAKHCVDKLSDHLVFKSKSMA